MKKRVGGTIIEVPFWYNFNKKIIRKLVSDFFKNKIFKIFSKEFLEWEEYEKKVKEIEEQNFKKSLKKF